MCANCGNATSESLEVAKVFRHVDESGESAPDTFSIGRVAVPFCPPCTAQHLSEVQPIAGSRRFLTMFRGRSAGEGLGLGAIMLFVLFLMTRSPSRSLLLPGIAAVLGFLSWICFRAAYRETEHLATPPPTSITSAFDFSEDHAKLFEREHRTVTLRNPTFADVFLARNTTRVWNAEDPANQKATKSRNLLLNVLIGAFVLWFAWFILKSLR